MLGLFLSCTTYAQDDTPCNRQTREGWEFMLNKLPKKLCLPEKTVFWDAHPPMDINGDGKMDVAVQFFKNGFSDGDTLFTAVYFMEADSSFSMIQRIDKLYVLYFQKRTEPYFRKMRESTRNMYLYDELAGIHAYPPNNKTIFDGDKIKISMEPGVGLKYRFEYTYDPTIKNWKQTKFIIDDDSQAPQIQSIEIEEPTPLITDFNITDYM